MQRRSDDNRNRALRRVIDLVVALPGVALVCVLAPWIALANRLTGDAGPVFYRGPRVGEGGRAFQIYKFRTMRETPGPDITFRGDARITEVGRLLRRSKLDELPQMCNVLRGEMSVVGPRPESIEYIDWNDPLHRAVLSVRPGITGPSQLAHLHEEDSLAGDVEYRTVVLPRKLALDRWYVEHATPRRDLKIILDTLRAIVFREH